MKTLIVISSLLFCGACATSQKAVLPAGVLQTSRDQLHSVPAIHIITTTSNAQDTSSSCWETWSAVGLGYRSEIGGLVDVYSEKQKKHYRIPANGGPVSIVEDFETTMGAEFRSRGLRDNCIENIINLANRKNSSIQNETFESQGRLLHRASCRDEFGHPISVEYDPEAKRILRTESWTRAATDSPNSTKVITAYEYPDLATLDSKLFEPEMPANATVQVASSDEQSRIQCMTNLRDLLGAIYEYEAEHPEGLPDDLIQAIRETKFFRMSLLNCPLLKDTGKLQYKCHVPEGKRSVTNLPYPTVVFECKLHKGQTILGFADGHCEIRKAP